MTGERSQRRAPLPRMSRPRDVLSLPPNVMAVLVTTIHALQLKLVVLQ